MEAKLFCGIMYSDSGVYEKAIEELARRFGNIGATGEEYDFSFTDYYLKEFGSNLKKRFVVFKNLIERENLADIKLLTCEIEKSFARGGRRIVNIDPGYITLNNVVVASTKELPHRVYLGKGIFADVQLILKRSEAITSSHTFADYEKNKGFFLGLRKSCRF